MTHTQAQAGFDEASEAPFLPLVVGCSSQRPDWQLNRAADDPTAGGLTAFLHSLTTVVEQSSFI